MLGKRRTAYDFVSEIVKHCSGHAVGRTDLYHLIKTSYKDFERWLNVAIDFNLVNNASDRYQTTQKGSDFLQVWKKLQTFLSAGY